MNLFNLKKRQAPTRENWIEYADFFNKNSWHPLNDANAFIIIMLIISFFFPIMLAFVFFAIYYRSLIAFGDEIDDLCDKGFEAQQIVHMIQSNHMQSLKEKLTRHPNLIDAIHRRRSLLYWAKHYNNLPAHKMIIDLIKERTIQRSLQKKKFNLSKTHRHQNGPKQ